MSRTAWLYSLLAGALALAACDDGPDDGGGGALPDAGADGGADLDRTPPVFGGVTAVEAVSEHQIQVSWQAATDDVSPPERINYRVFLATRPGAQDFARPATTATGVTTIAIAGLSPATTYFVVVRAADEAGNVEDNRVELSGATVGGAPASPEIAEVGLDGEPRGATVSAGALLLPLGPDGLQLLEMRDPAAPTPRATIDVGGEAVDAAADRVAGLAAVLRADGTVVPVEIGDLAAPAVAPAPLAVEGPGDRVGGGDRTISVVAGARLHVFDLPEGGEPSLRGVIDLPAAGLSLAAEPDRVFVGTEDGQVVAVDVEAEAPATIATVPTGAPVTRLVASEGLAVAAPDEGELALVDFSLPAPSVVGRMPAVDVGLLDLAGRTLVLARRTGVVDTLDVSVPDAPRLVGSNPGDAPATWVAALPGAAMFGAGARGKVVNTPPFARARFPAEGVSPRPGAWLDLVLSEPVDPATVELTVQADGQPVEGRVLVLDGGRKIRFKPAAPLGPGARVQATLGDDLRDRLGGRLPTGLDWNVLYGDGEACIPGPEVCDGVDNDCNGATDENDVCRGARNPSSAYPHTVDGAFTDWREGTAEPHEWFDVTPAVGRFTYLYVDFDGERLHLLNDWHYMGEDVDERCYNQFDVYTGGGQEHWNIKVYGTGEIVVTRNDEPFMSPDIEGAKGYGRSPQVPDADHTIWELSFPAMPGEWRVQLHDPGPTFNCEEGELATEPSRIAGALTSGGSTVLADARPARVEPRLERLEPGRGAPGTVVTAYGSDWPDAGVAVRFLRGGELAGAVEPLERTPTLVRFRVPQLEAGLYRLELDFGDQGRSNRLPFEVTAGECVPRECGDACGEIDDGCGEIIDCGPCEGITCEEGLACILACDGDEACVAACRERVDGNPAEALSALERCIEATGCRPGESCVLACPIETMWCAGEGLRAGVATCEALHACAAECGDDACRLECVRAAQRPAQEAYAAVVRCALQNECAPGEACREACPDQTVACFGPGEEPAPELRAFEPDRGPVGTRVTAFGAHWRQAPSRANFYAGDQHVATVLRFENFNLDSVDFVIPVGLEPGVYDVELLVGGPRPTNRLPFEVTPPPCEPRQCGEGECGEIDDGCGGFVDCGPCPVRTCSDYLSCEIACGFDAECAADCREGIARESRVLVSAVDACLDDTGCREDGRCELTCGQLMLTCFAEGEPFPEGEDACADIEACVRGCALDLERPELANCRLNCLQDATGQARGLHAVYARCAVSQGCAPGDDCREQCGPAADRCLGPLAPTLLSLEPAEGIVGTRVNAAGEGWGEEPVVRFLQDGEVVTVFAPLDTAPNWLEFAVPEVAPGAYEVDIVFVDDRTTGRLPFRVLAAGCDPACAPGQECVDGECVGDPVCDPACPDGQACVDGECVAAAACDPACGPGQECIDDQCEGGVQLGEWMPTNGPGPGPLNLPAVAIAGETIYVSGGFPAGGQLQANVYFTTVGEGGALQPWQEGAPLPQARNQHAMAAHGGYLYVVGGYGGVGVGDLASVSYAAIGEGGANGEWMDGPPLPAPRSGMCLVAAAGSLYVIGGDHDLAVLRAPILEDGSLGDWGGTTPLPGTRNEPVCFAHGGRIYVLGGSNSATVLVAEIGPEGALGPWNETTPLPGPVFEEDGEVFRSFRQQFGAALAGDTIWIVGGQGAPGGDQGSEEDVLAARIQPDGSVSQWVAAGRLPEPRRAHVAFALGGYLYVAGGGTGFGWIELGSNAVYTPIPDAAQPPAGCDPACGAGQVCVDGECVGGAELGQWTGTAAPADEPLRSAAAAVHGDFVYVTGGERWSRRGAPLDTVFIGTFGADGHLQAWRAGTSFDTPRALHATVAHGGSLYVIGGYGGREVGAVADVRRSILGDDGSNGEWFGLPRLPAGRFAHCAVAAAGHIYVIGGSVAVGAGWSVDASVLRARILEDGGLSEWEPATALPAPRGELSCANDGRRIYVVSGSNEEFMPVPTVLVNEAAVDGTLGEWREIAPIPSVGIPGEPDGRTRPAVVVADGHVWVAGGGNSQGDENDVLSGAILEDGRIAAWTPQGRLPWSRIGHVGFTHGGFLYLVGGGAGEGFPDAAFAPLAAP